MADPFVAEIRIFPFNFAPGGWAWCDGQLLPISQNTPLFALIGTTYGGNGRSNFALPNLQGRAPMYYDQGPGLSYHDIGETGGEETISLLVNEMPTHTHALRAQNESGDEVATPAGNTLNHPTSGNLYNNAANQPVVAMSGNAIAPVGGNQPHNNMQPYLTLGFAIALQGVFPPRS